MTTSDADDWKKKKLCTAILRGLEMICAELREYLGLEKSKK